MGRTLGLNFPLGRARQLKWNASSGQILRLRNLSGNSFLCFDHVQYGICNSSTALAAHQVINICMITIMIAVGSW